MKDAAAIKIVSIAGSVAIVIVMLLTDGITANTAAATLAMGLSGLGGYAIAETRKATKDV